MTSSNNRAHIVAGTVVVMVSSYFYLFDYRATSMEAILGFGVALALSVFMLISPVLEERKGIPLLKRIIGSKPVEYLKNRQ
jgi:hypothetical protein